MKKLFYVLIAVFAMCMFSSCEKADNFTIAGTWQQTAAFSEGKMYEFDAEEMKDAYVLKMLDATFQILLSSGESIVEGSFTYLDDKLTLLPTKMAGEALPSEYQSAYKMVYKVNVLETNKMDIRLVNEDCQSYFGEGAILTRK